MNMDFSGRQTRHVGVYFTEDERARRAEKAMNEQIQQSLGDLLKAQGDISYVSGVRAAVDAIACQVAPLVPGWGTDRDIAPWLAHVVARTQSCTCGMSTDYDGGLELEYCPWYEDKANQHLWYLAYYGLTEEEYVEQKREEARQEAERKARQEEERRNERLRQLHQLAADFGVDPKYLP